MRFKKTIAEILMTPPLLQDTKLGKETLDKLDGAIKYRVVTEPEPGDGKWHPYHDFFWGYGWRKTDEKCQSWNIRLGDIEVFLPGSGQEAWVRLRNQWRSCWQSQEPTGPTYTDEELDAVWLYLQPFIEERERTRQEWLKKHPPGKFEKIVIPKVKKEYPTL